MLKRSIILFLVFNFFWLSGCESSLIDNPENERHVVVFFSSQSLSSSLKATSDEETISEIILYGVDADDNVLKSYLVEDPSLTVTLDNVSVKVTSFYAIANPSEDMKDEKDNISTVSELMEMICDFPDAPSSPFMMSGKGDVSEYSVNIELFRTVAKIEIIGKNGLQINSIQVTNTPDKGYVFEQEIPSIPTCSLTYYSTNNNVSSNTVTLYVAENDTNNPTKFEVTGAIDGKNANYEFKLKQNDAEIPILRNKKYQVGVAPTGNVSVTIEEWDAIVADDYVVPKPKPNYPDYSNGIKILAIGNSYSEDAMRYMFNMLVQLGVEPSKITLVCAYIGGGTLEQHVNNISLLPSKRSDYRELVFSANGYVEWKNNSARLIDELVGLEWDIITLQQQSRRSGQPGEYEPHLGTLIQYVLQNAPPGYRLGWHMTWAFGAGYNELSYYSNSQLTMYNDICSTVQNNVVSSYPAVFDFIIPSGTAIQNARGYFGDNLNRDGSHLNESGCFIAGAMWVKTITGLDISELTKPFQTYEVSDPYTALSIQIGDPAFTAAIKAVNDAHNTPFGITYP